MKPKTRSGKFKSFLHVTKGPRLTTAPINRQKRDIIIIVIIINFYCAFSIKRSKAHYKLYILHG